MDSCSIAAAHFHRISPRRGIDAVVEAGADICVGDGDDSLPTLGHQGQPYRCRIDVDTIANKVHRCTAVGQQNFNGPHRADTRLNFRRSRKHVVKMGRVPRARFDGRLGLGYSWRGCE